MIKIFFLSILFSSPLFSQMVPLKEDNPRYWKLSCNYFQYAVSHAITIKVEDMGSSLEKIRTLSEKYKATDLNVSGNYQYSNYYGNYQNNQSPQNSTVQFRIPMGKDENLVKEVFSIGTVRNYNVSEPWKNSNISEIQNRYDKISKELEQNEKVFKDLPIAKILMEDLKTGFANCLKSYDAVKNKVQFSISVVGREDASKK